MKIIKYHESYSTVMLHKLLPSALFMLGYLALITIVLFLTPFVPVLRIYFWGIFIGALIAFIIARIYFEPFWDEVGNYRTGKRGEEEVATMLNELMDDNYTYIENYMVPNSRIGDIDGLLIGPKGIFVIEIKTYTGVFRVSGTDLFRRLKGDVYKLYRRNPFQQVLRQKEYLSKYLKERGIALQVTSIVVIVDGKISAINGETKAFITEKDKLVNHIFNLSPARNWTVELTNQVVASLGLQDTSVEPRRI